jgi:CHAD domain-containing protein
MTTRFHRNRGVASSLRHVAVCQLGTALTAISRRRLDETETIHLVRQQLKRLRALIRLPRGQFDAFDAENALFRHLAVRLARTRDADVLGETYDSIVAAAGLDPPASVRERVVASKSRSSGKAGRGPLLEGEIAASLVVARRRARRWRFEGKGFVLIADGLKRTYEKMRASEARAAERPTAQNFHDWRKQVKYHANQLALLSSVAPEIFRGYRNVADKLAETLGQHHDLDMLLEALVHLQLAEHRLVEAIGKRRARLEAKAFRLGHELTAERPTDFLRRIEAGWKEWHR